MLIQIIGMFQCVNGAVMKKNIIENEMLVLLIIRLLHIVVVEEGLELLPQQ